MCFAPKDKLVLKQNYLQLYLVAALFMDADSQLGCDLGPRCSLNC